MEKILVSACLLGQKVRYDGQDKHLPDILFQQWQDEGRLMAICPEVSGDLPIPRPAAEIIGGSGENVLASTAKVVDKLGQDVSAAFIKGAEQALALAQQHNIKLAILTARSPSCGSTEVYDGTFSGNTISGMGVTTALLKQQGIQVFSNQEIEVAADYLRKLESD